MDEDTFEIDQLGLNPDDGSMLQPGDELPTGQINTAPEHGTPDHPVLMGGKPMI